ncbi:MAG: hypothetical protein LBV74_10265 [Tannerella sp.]|jgi:hypothetical protein|nr:hypothetical protein [Tannerella sp.]
MKYLSIIRFFEYCNIGYSEPDLSKIKKIISAEYSLSDNGIISINGLDYTKDAVLQEIERDDFLRRLQFHGLIWDNKDLLHLLEQDLVGEHAESWFYLSENEAFRNFISPYFAYSFNKVMHRYLRNAFLIKAGQWLKFLAFVEYIDENQALTSTRGFISETLKLFKNTSKDTYRYHYPKLIIWAKQPVSLFINTLPGSLSDEKEDLVIALINLTVELQKSDKRLCLGISENLMKVTGLDAVHTDLIKKNHSIFKSKNSAGHSIWSVVRWGFIIVGGTKLFIYVIAILIGLIAKCSSIDDTEKKTKGTYNPYLYDISHQEFLDIRSEYSKILLDTTSVLIQDEPVPLSVANLYYFMIENNPEKEYSTLRIVNKSPLPVDFYIGDEESTLMDFVVHQEGYGNPGLIEVHHSSFDIIVSILDSARTRSVMEEKIIPVLISDSLDLSPHTIRTEHPDKTIRIDNLSIIYDFTIEFSRDSIFIYGKDNNRVGWIYRKL